MSVRSGLCFILCISLATSACVTENPSRAIVVSLAHDAEIVAPDGARRNIKMGPNLKLEEVPLYISAAGRESVLLVPVKETAATVRVNLRKTPDAPDTNALKEQLKEQLKFQKDMENIKLSETYSKLLPRFFDAQILISKGKQEEALTNLSVMRAEFPDVPYLSFFVADVLHGLGRNEEALAAVNEASKNFPNDKRGALLKLSIEKNLSRKAPSPKSGRKQ